MLLCRRLQDQLKVFVHQAQWKLRTVVVDRGPCQLPHMSRSYDRGLRQDFEQPFAIEADFLPEDHRLSDRLHANAQQRVDDQLHRGSRARTAEKKVSFGDRVKYWLGGEEQFRVAPASRVRVPPSAAGVLPEMATSSTSIPALAPSRCTSRELSGEIVLISRTTVPDRAPAKTPSGPVYTLRTARSLVKQVRSTSAVRASSTMP